MLSTTSHFKEFNDLDTQTKKNVFYRFYLKNPCKNKKELENIVKIGISTHNYNEVKGKKNQNSKKKCFSKWRSFWKLNPCTDTVKENVMDVRLPVMVKIEPPKSLPLTRRRDNVNYGPLIDSIDIHNAKHKQTKLSSSVIESSNELNIVLPPPLPLRKSLPQVNQIDSNYFNRSTNSNQTLSIHYTKSIKSNQTIENFRQLRRIPWYWGPLTKYDAELLLQNKEDGVFLVRDSGHEAYVLSVSFRAGNKIYHTRIEHSLGKFSFWLNDRNAVKAASIVDFINQLIEESRNGHVRYLINDSGFGGQLTETGRVSVSLLYPLSRFKVVQSLMHLCRFEILLLIRQDHINSLKIPNYLKKYLKAPQYFIERIDDFL